MFTPYSLRAIPMSLAPHLSFCDAPTMLEVGRQSRYPPSEAGSIDMSPHSYLLGMWRSDHDRWRNHRDEVWARTLLKIR